ncbi:hypothetical protein CDD81_3646 [Ophiocordyceps australis]|uniref:GDP/GTP exchange factor Sec2 N-terminal domain-containing protein n=1 Tax=Ophiocordyceps australis TaxID=1399860 RepID=A0A2C5XAP4_9HYPO|nr:hypothetical protein CDD81_3646 [Ophiocordyceps australis]
MSTAATLTMMSTTQTITSAPSCPGCGITLGHSAIDDTQAALLIAQARIEQLEDQVRQLNDKASAAVSRWAEYEAELGKLRSEQRRQSASNNTLSPPAAAATVTATAAQPQPSSPPQLGAGAPPSPTRASFFHSAPSRLSALLYPRKASPAPSTPTSTAEDLLEALTREQTLRREVEGRLSATSKEVEELSASLFEQANKMVADERRARAHLEERVGELERRDVDKRRRLERLELAMDRIEKVRNLLGDK